MNKKITPFTICKYTFNQKFETVWNMLKNIKKTNQMINMHFEGLTTTPVFEKGKNSYEVDSEFYFTYKNSSTIFMKTVEVVKLENFALIKWECKSTPENLIYDMIYKLKSANDSKHCDFLLEIEYKCLRIFKKGELKQMQKENYFIYSYFEKCIEQQKCLKIQEEKISISSDINSLSNFLINLKNFHNNIGVCCDGVNYEGELLEVGKKVVLEWTIKQKLNVVLFVNKLEKTEDLFTLVLESVESSMPVPNQIIEWKMERLSTGESLVRFKHIYKEKIIEESLKSLSKSKKEILHRFKKKFEPYVNQC